MNVNHLNLVLLMRVNAASKSFSHNSFLLSPFAAFYALDVAKESLSKGQTALLPVFTHC